MTPSSSGWKESILHDFELQSDGGVPVCLRPGPWTVVATFTVLPPMAAPVSFRTEAARSSS